MTIFLCAVHRSLRMLPLVCALALLAGPAAVEAACPDEPGSGTPSCGGDGVATQGNTSDTPQGAGNPINVITGNKYQREVDLPALPGVLGLEIVRHYNSALSGAQSSPGILGRGWRLSYETDLTVHGHTIEITQADGTLAWFSRDLMQPEAQAVVYRAASPLQGRILANKTAQGTEYTWFWLNGRQLNFNAAGKLVQIVAPSGEFLTLQRDIRGWLVKVTDPQGRSLHLHYLDNRAIAADRSNERFRGVQSIDSPVGRFTYAYGSTPPDGARVATAQLAANLVKVGVPTHYDADQPVHAWTERGVSSSSISRLYHYENAHYPTLLTGISVLGQGSDGKLMNQRLVTWGYDGTGRANLSVKGVPARYEVDKEGKTIEPKRLVAGTGIEQVTLAWPEPGKTVLTNSLGRQTTYKTAVIAGEHRILEVRGAGCASCGPANIRYGYDSLGRLVEETQLAVTGEPVKTVKTERDGLGRVIKVSTIVWRNGKPRAPRWQLRYAYGRTETDVPSLIAKPSVVPGREHITRIRYGNTPTTTYQPVEIAETGFIPTMDGNAAAQSITRTMQYRYNRLGQRIETDGPLANAQEKPGPANSDITVTTYDSKTKLVVKTIAPGGIVTEVLERDSGLRPSKIRTIDGTAMHTATIRSNWRGQPEEIKMESALLVSSPGNRSGTPVISEASQLVRTLHYRYDANGNLTSISLPDGLENRFEYDVAGHLTHRVLPDGSRVVMTRDTENLLHSVASYRDGNLAKDKALARMQYSYDAWGRPVRLEDKLGLLRKASYTDFGAIAEITNAMGVVVRFGYDDNGMLNTRTQAANTPQAATVRMGYDTHGQPTVVTDANGVTTQRRYDDFGRKIVEVNPDRGITLYRYDVAGRMIARIDETGVTTRYSYDHANRLLAMGADKQTDMVQYRYDGQRLAEVISTPDGNVTHAVERSAYQYNAWGQVTKEIRWIAKVDANAASASHKVEIKPVAGNQLQFITRNRYDDAARLVEQVLPDGHRLTYRYTATEGSGKANSNLGQLNAILFDDQVLLSDITQSPAGGVIGYTHGNGIRQEVRLDGRGRIEQLQVIAHRVGSEPNWWQKIIGWFVAGEPMPEKTIYRQTNRYDAADRLIEIDRSRINPATGGALQPVMEQYGYDALDRLTAMETGNGAVTHLSYDRGGNRISETTNVVPLPRTVAADGASLKATARRYHYALGTNRLVNTVQTIDARVTPAMPNIATEVAQLIRTVWLYHPTGVPLAWFGMPAANNTEDQSVSSRRIVYNAARRPVAVYDAQNKLLARYHYNLRGERIAKTLYADGSNTGLRQTVMSKSGTEESERSRTTYSLYRGQRLAAEADSNGRITAHYVYLSGKPVAKIDMTVNESFLRRAWTYIVTAAGTIRPEYADPNDSNAAIYAIHTDHLGTPQAVSDEAGQIVWQAQTDAFGRARITYAAMSATTGKTGKRFEMNLRLLGQLYDEETGANQNYYRDYDPALGRYTTPDPMGLHGGLNPYSYVSNNPLTNIDPLGLYEEDIHYYMTYFLARVAGVDARMAYLIATGDQYVDNNPITYPLNPSYFTAAWDIIAHNATVQNRLARYHFTQTAADDISSDPATRYINPDNAQLTRLFDASIRAGEVGSECAKAVLFGEYLHAFEDTFAHRLYDNTPVLISRGLGHAVYGHMPDHTYNVDWRVADPETGEVSGANWQYNEDRSLEMEHEVFNRLSLLWSDGKSQAHTWEEIEPLLIGLTGFNATKEDSRNTSNFAGTSAKVDMLNKQLNDWGYKFVGVDGGEEALNLKFKNQGLYDSTQGKKDRENFLRYKEDGDGHKAGDSFQKTDPKFTGTILP